MRKKVLVVDDEESIRSSLRLLLKNNFDVSTAEDGNEALSMFDSFEPDLVLLDVMMPNLDGIQTLKQLKEKKKDVSIIMLTAANTVRTAVQAIKWGAVDYLNKPFDVEELTTLIIETLEGNKSSGASSSTAATTTTAKKELLSPAADFGPMVGHSLPMQKLFKKVEQVAHRGTTILITGESGTGKELVARQIHALSERKDEPFVAINCAAIPESLIESELFGHEKGAFTNAVEKRIGHFELADKGTLFLDEIGELSLPVQVKMLRFLQEQEFYRVGSSKSIRVDVRIIAATNKNLEDLIVQGSFREDLYYRINVVSILIPPLRDRFEDIPDLIGHFVKKFSPVYDDRTIVLEESAMETMVHYDWPGNVRELENVVESLMALVQNDAIEQEDLPAKVNVKGRMESLIPLKQEVFNGQMKFEDAEKIFETEMIMKALRKTNYVQTKAAELLGISRRILKYKMDKLGISDKAKPETINEEVQE